MLVDLPGYGFAKRSKVEAAQWQEMIFAYLRGRARLRRVALLIDARRGAMDSDRQVMELLDRAAVSYFLVLTKVDELDTAAQSRALTAAGMEAVQHNAALRQVVLTSALKGVGIADLRAHLAPLAG
jgi:GTP-binding protein